MRSGASHSELLLSASWRDRPEKRPAPLLEFLAPKRQRALTTIEATEWRDQSVIAGKARRVAAGGAAAVALLVPAHHRGRLLPSARLHAAPVSRPHRHKTRPSRPPMHVPGVATCSHAAESRVTRLQDSAQRAPPGPAGDSAPRGRDEGRTSASRRLVRNEARQRPSMVAARCGPTRTRRASPPTGAPTAARARRGSQRLESSRAAGR